MACVEKRKPSLAYHAQTHLAKEHALILGEPQGVDAIVAVPVDGTNKLVKAEGWGGGSGRQEGRTT
jgi:hypothetical protein